MSVPASWTQLPGPSDFVADVVRDLASGYIVVVGLPRALTHSSMSIELAESVDRRGLGSFRVFRQKELMESEPRHLYRDSVEDGCSGWVAFADTRCGDMIAEAWRDFVFSRLDCSSSSGLCVAFHHDVAEQLEERKGLRIRLWREFVTSVDARVIVHRRERGLDRSVECVELKCALVAELSGTDLDAAHRLSEYSLKDLMDVRRFPYDRVWSAQVSVLLPLVNRERRRILNTYAESWTVPYSIDESRTIDDPSDLELSHMVRQALNIPVIAKELGFLRWLLRVRNLIAHMRVVSWATLVSPHIVGRINFRD